MLSYLTRTSSADRLAEVMYHNAKCEGTLNERRKRVGKLRHDLDRLEAQVHRVDDLATNLQADALAAATLAVAARVLPRPRRRELHGCLQVAFA